MFLFVSLVFLLIVFMNYDVHYFFRFGYVVFVSKYCRKKLEKFSDESDIYGVVLPKDIVGYNMNNSRYLRENDFARLDHTIRSGFLEEVLRKGCYLVNGTSIRYRQPTKVFSLYKIVTRPVYWDSKQIYFEHKLITLGDDIIHCEVYTRVACKINVEEIIKKISPQAKKPEMTDDLSRWIESCDVSSDQMKKSMEIENIQMVATRQG